MRGFLRVLWMALVLVTVALVSALVTMRMAVHGREVEVPDLQGKTPSEARRLAEDRGLGTQIERQYYSATVPEGRVLSQTPQPGMVVRRGWELRLALSLGPQRVKIPQVVGESQRAAGITLEQRALDTSIAEINLPGTTADQVLAQDPPANAAHVDAPKVNLLVANAVPEAYVMPSFVGRPLGSVALAIKDAGFKLGKVTFGPAAAGADEAAVAPGGSSNGAASEGTSSGAPVSTSLPQPSSRQSLPAGMPSPAAIVISQQPAAGQKIVVGAEIRLVVR